MAEQVDVIIVNWNTGGLLKKCLTSIQRLPEQELISRIVVVDNASQDSSFTDAQQTLASYEKIVWLPLQKNAGFAGGNNIGIDHANSAKKNSHVLLLNPDTAMQPGSLQALVETLQQSPKTGIVGPELRNPDGTHQPSVRSFPTFGVFILLFLKMHKLAEKLGLLSSYMMKRFDYSKETIVDQVMGACFLIRNTVFQQIGGLDEEFFVWFEEVDYCKRAKDAGWNTLYTPNGEVVHYGGASFHQLVGFKKSIPMLKSALHYSQKHLGALATTALRLLFPISLVLTIPASLAHIAKRSALRDSQ